MIHATINAVNTGRNIRMLMKEKHYSVSDVAAALGLSTSNAVYKWLRGDSLPSIDNLYALSIFLDTDIDSLIEGEVDYYE